jgi:WD40 repeat protein
VGFSPDDRRLATGSTDSTVRVWDLATGRELAHLRGHRNEVITVRFSPDGRTLATACADGTVKLWDVASATEDDYPMGESLALSPDGRRLAVKQPGDRAIVLWDLAAKRELGRLDPGRAGAIPLAFSPRGDALYTAATSGPETPCRQATIWSLDDWRAAATISTPAASPRWPSLSPDGRFLVLGNWQPRPALVLIDLAARRCVTSVKGHFAAFSSDGRLLATLGTPNHVRIYDTGDWHLMAQFRVSSVGPMAFSPDGRWLVVGGLLRLEVCDARSWRIVDAFQAHSGRIGAVAFSPDGRTLATSGNAAIVKLWNTKTWRPTLALEHPERHPDSLQFTPDGSALATLDGRSVRFWRAAPFRETNPVAPLPHLPR